MHPGSRHAPFVLGICLLAMACGEDANRSKSSPAMDAAAELDGSLGDSGQSQPGEPVPSEGCGGAAFPKSGRYEIDVDGTVRQYDVGLPSGYGASVPHRLVFVWHGLGGTSAQVAQTSFYGLQPLADSPTIFVSGQGLPVPQGQSGWSNDGNRDVQFVRVLLAQLRSEYCLDDSRIFSTGVSYGGIMSNSIGCALGDEFRAIAPVMGAGPDLGFNCTYGASAECTGQVAVWLTHGTMDPTVPFCDGERSRDHWLADNGCDDGSDPVGSDGCVSYRGCDEGHPVVWCPTELAHVPPNFTGQAVMEFFARF